MFGNRDASFTPATPAAWVTLADVKAVLGVTGSDQDARITALLATASEQIEKYTGCLVAQREVTEFAYPEDQIDVFVLSRYPVSALTSFHIDDAAETLTDYRLAAAQGMIRRKDGTAITGREFKFVYSVGWAAGNVPAALVEAAKQLVKELYNADGRDSAVRRESLPDAGEVEYRDDHMMFKSNGIALPVTVAALVAPCVRRGAL